MCGFSFNLTEDVKSWNVSECTVSSDSLKVDVSLLLITDGQWSKRCYKSNPVFFMAKKWNILSFCQSSEFCLFKLHFISRRLEERDKLKAALTNPKALQKEGVCFFYNGHEFQTSLLQQILNKVLKKYILFTSMLIHFITFDPMKESAVHLKVT